MTWLDLSKILSWTNIRFWHIAALQTVTRHHGVSGVEGSNPLVLTKNPLRTSLLRLVFYACFLNGE